MEKIEIDFITKVKSLNLPLGQYCVWGSGVLEIHGIRKARDVDLVVTESLYQELKKRGWKRKWFFRRFFTFKGLVSGNNEAFTHMKWKKYRVSTEDIIKNSEIIDGVAFMSLPDFLFYKRHLPRKKDKDDVKLIEDYSRTSFTL